MVKKYIPQKGDLVILTFDPSSGHEQKGRRPALIISNEVFNKALGLAIACPITNTDRNFPFHIKLEAKNLKGYIMTEQIKSIDFNARKVKFVEKVDEDTLNQVLGITKSIIFWLNGRKLKKDGNYAPVHQLQEIMTNPYNEQTKEIEEKYYIKNPQIFLE